VTASADAEMGRKRVAATQLIAAYRYLGSRWANLDPLQRQERPSIPELEPSFYGFTDADMDTVFNISNTYFGPETATLRDLLNFLRDTYTRSIGAEYMYISTRLKSAGCKSAWSRSARPRTSPPTRKNTSWSA
jgi:2-oxoglutarate dehydrogenase E1 component